MSIKRLLDEEIERQIEDLKTKEIGTDEYKSTVDGVSKLLDRTIEMDKLDQEALESREEREFDQQFKSAQMEQESKNKVVDRIINIAAIVLPIGCTIWGTVKTLKFEEKGTVTTIMGRGFINKLLPKK